MIKGLHVVKSKKAGKPVRWYVYAWRGGPCIAKRIGGGEPTLTAEEHRAFQAAVEADRQPPPGTLLSAIREWRGDNADKASREWRNLQPSTRQTWGRHLDLIEEKWGTTPLKFWSDRRMSVKVVNWRDSRAATPRSADIGITVLKALLDFARLRGHVDRNVAEGIPRLYRGGNREEVIWTDEDFERFAAVAPQRIVDGLRLCSVTGLRRADLLGLKWSEVGDGAIIRVAAKMSKGKRRRAVVPLIADAKALLDELRGRYRAEGVDHVLVDSLGRAWNPLSFSAQFNAARDKAGICEVGGREQETETRKKHLHDVRGTFCTHLCRTGLTNEEIARIMAWAPDRVENIRRVYVDDAAIVVALAERIGASTVKQPVKSTG